MADVYGRSPKKYNSSKKSSKKSSSGHKHPQANKSKSSKKSGDQKLADYKASHSDEPSTPTIKESTEEERKAKQLITSSVDRSKDENRTKAALNDIKVKNNNKKAKEAFENSGGNIPAFNDQISLIPESVRNSDMMVDAGSGKQRGKQQANHFKRTIGHGAGSRNNNPAIVPDLGDNVVGASIINIEGIKDKVSNIINKDKISETDKVYTKDQIADMTDRERASYYRNRDAQRQREQEAYHEAEADFREEKAQENSGGIFDKIRNIDEKYSEYVPTLNEISDKGAEFRQNHPEAADKIYNTMETLAGSARTNTNRIDEDLGLKEDTVGTVVGQFSVGAYEGFQEKPVSTTGKTLVFAALPGAIGVAGKAAGAAGSVVTGTRVGAGAAKIISPVVSPVASRIMTPTGLKAAEVGMGALFGAQMYNEIKAPIITETVDEEGNIETSVRDPTAEEMAHRSGDIFATEIVPLAAGLGIASKGSEVVTSTKKYVKDNFDYAIVKKTEPQQLIIKTEVPVAKPETIPKTNDELFTAAKNNRNKLDAEMKTSSNTAEQSEMQAKYGIDDVADDIKDKINYDTKPDINTFIGKSNDDVAELYTKIPIGKEGEVAKLFESGNIRKIRTNEGSFLEFEPKLIREPTKPTGFNKYNSAKVADDFDDIGKIVYDDIGNPRLRAGNQEEQFFIEGSDIFTGTAKRSLKQKIDDALPYRFEKKVDLEPAELVSSPYQNNIIDMKGGFKSNAVSDIEAGIENRMIKGIDEAKMLSGPKAADVPIENIFTTRTTFNRKTNSFNTEVSETRMINRDGNVIFKKDSFSTSQKLENGKPDMIFEDDVVESVVKKNNGDFIVTEEGMMERKLVFNDKTNKISGHYEKYKPADDFIDDIKIESTSKNVVDDIKVESRQKYNKNVVESEQKLEPQLMPEMQTAAKRSRTTFKEPEVEIKINNKSQIDDLFNKKTKKADIEVRRPKEFEGKKSSKSNMNDDFDNIAKPKGRVEVKPKNDIFNKPKSGRGIKPIINTRGKSDPFSESKTNSNTDIFAKNKNDPEGDVFYNSDSAFGFETEVETKTDTKVKPMRAAKSSTTMPPFIPPVLDFDDNKKASRKKSKSKSGKVMRVKNKVKEFEDMI